MNERNELQNIPKRQFWWMMGFIRYAIYVTMYIEVEGGKLAIWSSWTAKSEYFSERPFSEIFGKSLLLSLLTSIHCIQKCYELDSH